MTRQCVPVHYERVVRPRPREEDAAVYTGTPHDPPHSVPVLATSSNEQRISARPILQRTVYRCSPRHSQHRYKTRVDYAACRVAKYN